MNAEQQLTRRNVAVDHRFCATRGRLPVDAHMGVLCLTPIIANGS